LLIDGGHDLESLVLKPAHKGDVVGSVLFWTATSTLGGPLVVSFSAISAEVCMQDTEGLSRLSLA
jgi:hypothetical protein